MTEEFDPEDDHRMYELEHLRSETTMIDRPTMLPASSRPGEVTRPAPAAQIPQTATRRSEAATPAMATPESASGQLSLPTVAAACVACLAVFAVCYLLVRYAL